MEPDHSFLSQLKYLLNIFTDKKEMVLIKKLTVLDNSLPDSIILRHSGIISVASKKFITCCSSVYNTNTFLYKGQYKYMTKMQKSEIKTMLEKKMNN